MMVVKLGGSLQNSRYLPALLAQLMEHAAGRIVIVPGGGEFADRVRQQQVELKLDSMTAHCMALRAMEQFGSVLISHEPGLQAASSIQAIHDLLIRKKIPVWFPYEMVADNPSIPASWDVTSDSLSLWLAEQLRCRYLFMLKPVCPANDNYSAQYLSEKGFLDRAFADWMAKTSVQCWWLYSQNLESFMRMLDLRDYPATIMKEITAVNR
jgi:Uncharacterized archaeal kinase related to aspartokinases, uridylate kinases